MEKKEEALFYRMLEDKLVKCDLCPQNCYIPNKSTGRCGVRENEDGKLYSLNYGKVAAYHMDAIEKKPLYHFYPGSRIFSIGSFGCNLDCGFCQNWQIARKHIQGIDTTGENLVDIAKREKNNVGIAYTYNEPSVWYEFVYETAQLGHKAGLKNILVTNGFINEKPFIDLLPYIDAMNIDLKSAKDDFYKEICKGYLQPVKDTITRASKMTHVEITTLIVNHLNDEPDEMKEIAKFISQVNQNIPLHISRYFPAHRMEIPPTPIEKIMELYHIAKEYLNYVYIGNVSQVDHNTYCPKCHGLIVDRNLKTKIELEDGKCKSCGKEISILYK